MVVVQVQTRSDGRGMEDQKTTIVMECRGGEESGITFDFGFICVCETSCRYRQEQLLVDAVVRF